MGTAATGSLSAVEVMVVLSLDNRAMALIFIVFQIIGMYSISPPESQKLLQ